jgi:aldehyde dehydrogenase (NAD+)
LNTQPQEDLCASWVAGRWLSGTGEPSVVTSPINGGALHSFHAAGEAEIEAAIVGAQHAAKALAETTQADRAAALRALAAGLRRRAEAIAEATILANGCPRKQALAMQALSAVALLEAFAPLAENHSLEETRKGLRGGTVIVRKAPVGVSVGIAPWNAPVFLCCVKIAGALAASAPLILKPAPETIGATILLAEALAEIDLPKGAVSVIHGGRDVGRRLVSDSRVAKVSFTGSTRGGAEVAAACAPRFARCTLELGGKSAAILLDDVDLPAVMQELIGAMLQNNGQICGAQTRLLIDRKIYDRTIDALSAAFEALRLGDPRDAATDIGPVISAAQRDRLVAAIDSAVVSGARIVAGGELRGGEPPGYYVRPSLLDHVDPGSPIAREELFGPVVVAFPFSDEDEAIALANDSPYGLAGSVWTADSARGLAVAARVSSGTVSINSKRILDFGAPFGGLRRSGMGQELGPEGIDSYLQAQSLILPSETPARH